MQYAMIIWKLTISLLETELPGESGGSSGTLSSSTDDMLLQGLPKIIRDYKKLEIISDDHLSFQNGQLHVIEGKNLKTIEQINFTINVKIINS